MKKPLMFALLLVWSALLFDCKQEDNVPVCANGPVNFRLLNDDLNPGAQVKDFNPEDSLSMLVIQNENELFDRLSISFLRTKIDFKKETLLVGLVRTHSLAGVVDQQVESNCATNEVTLRSTIRIGTVPSRDYVPVFAIVPKISDTTKFRFVANKI